MNFELSCNVAFIICGDMDNEKMLREANLDVLVRV
jgi:hypothetical protein